MSDSGSPARTESRHRGLQEELREIVDVVGPVPLVDLLLERAFEVGATDIHFDPGPNGVTVRLRVDGMLHEVLELNASTSPQVISRLKLMGGMDITEKRFAQDGHIASAAFRDQRDIRVGSGPTIYGERIVLRLMPASSAFNEIEDLGLEENQLTILESAIRVPHGMVLSVGPVGSGKSTSTYSFLNRLNEPHRSLVTIEDPVERRIDGAVQIQTDNKIKFGFADALRGVLRQDPNVIMVGEIRDADTAHIAARAALTGIQVLSTLHAHDTGATIDVFREFGIPPMFIADSITCVIAQRLLRMVCSKHRETYQPDAATVKMLGLDPAESGEIELVRGVPHPDNFGTGYSGRTGIFEVLRIDDHIREAILHGHSSKELTNFAVTHGLQSLEQSAIKKVLAGVTTVEEMHRVLL